MNNQPLLPIIQVKNLCKAYGRVQAVNDISFTVQAGEVFGFLGPNGAGKTTTLSILEGLRRPDSGSVTLFGMDMARYAPEIKRRIGVQLQSTSLMAEFSALEQILLFARLYGRQLSRQAALEMLEKVSLAEKANVLPHKLSGGQKQRLALALAQVNQPEVLFLDEPTSGLDPQSRRMLWESIRQHQAEGRTIVLTTHYMDEAEALCQRVAIIDQGKLAALDTPAALIGQIRGLASITIPALLDIRTLSGLPGVATVHAVQDRLQLHTDDIAATLEALLELARTNCLRLGDLLIKQPNLDDVFLQLTGNTIRAE